MAADIRNITRPARRGRRLVRGRGKFVDDVEKQGVGHAVFVRSPHAHARIVSLSIEEAAKAKGVIGVITAADMEGVGTW